MLKICCLCKFLSRISYIMRAFICYVREYNLGNSLESQAEFQTKWLTRKLFGFVYFSKPLWLYLTFFEKKIVPVYVYEVKFLSRCQHICITQNLYILRSYSNFKVRCHFIYLKCFVLTVVPPISLTCLSKSITGIYCSVSFVKKVLQTVQCKI